MLQPFIAHCLDRSLTLADAIEVVSLSMIRGALERHSGNQSRAARALGVHRNTLTRHIEKHRDHGAQIHTRTVHGKGPQPAAVPGGRHARRA